MLRRQPPTLLLYGFGLALVLSLGVNGFLLMDKSGQPAYHGAAVLASNGSDSLLQEQLQACSRGSQQKDSLIHVLETGASSNPNLVKGTAQ